MTDILKEVKKVVVDLDLERIVPVLTEAIEKGESATDLLETMSAGMVMVGQIYERGDYFLSELVLAGSLMKEGVKVLEPHLDAGSTGKKGKVIVCTVKGDVHDIGKNLVVTMLSSTGFEVLDLGIDIHEDQIVKAVRESGATAIGLSVLLTPMIGSVTDVVTALKKANLRDKVKISIGGACTTPEMVEGLGVDAVGKDPMEAIEIFESFCS